MGFRIQLSHLSKGRSLSQNSIESVLRLSPRGCYFPSLCPVSNKRPNVQNIFVHTTLHVLFCFFLLSNGNSRRVLLLHLFGNRLRLNFEDDTEFMFIFVSSLRNSALSSFYINHLDILFCDIAANSLLLFFSLQKTVFNILPITEQELLVKSWR